MDNYISLILGLFVVGLISLFAYVISLETVRSLDQTVRDLNSEFGFEPRERFKPMAPRGVLEVRPTVPPKGHDEGLICPDGWKAIDHSCEWYWGVTP